MSSRIVCLNLGPYRELSVVQYGSRRGCIILLCVNYFFLAFIHISLFRTIVKKRKEFEYKIQRRTKCKEDYLRYIQYEMDLLKLLRLRREVGLFKK